MTQEETRKQLDKVRAARIRLALYYIDLPNHTKTKEILEDVANNLADDQ